MQKTNIKHISGLKFIVAAALLCGYVSAQEIRSHAVDQTDKRQSTTKQNTQQPPKRSIEIDVEEPPPSPRPEIIDEGEVLKIDSNLVNLNVRVIDRGNRPVVNLAKKDFQVFENNIPQPIEFFSTEEVPIQYGLVVDNSASLRSQIDKVIEAGKIIINNNRPEDETFLERFIDKDNIETMQDFTAHKRLLTDAIDDMYVQGGQTALIDAIYLAAEHIASYKKGNLSDRRRRAMVLVTDGEDRKSFYKSEQLFANLREQDVQIFIIGFVKDLDGEGGFIRKSPREKAIKFLENLATQTGGRAFFPASLSELPQIANEITRDMRTQYVIGYNPTNKERDGSYRAIKVTVANTESEKRVALTRSGYTAPLGERPVGKNKSANSPTTLKKSTGNN